MNTEKSLKTDFHQSFLRISKRDSISQKSAWAIRAGAVLLALVVNALFVLAITGLDPISLYATMFKGVFGDSFSRWEFIKNSAKLLCIAVALAPAFKMRYWNIGGEGQVLMGALASTIIMYTCDSLPSLLLVLLMLIVGLAVGALWAFIPAAFKAKFNTNETLFTLMMNYIAMNLVNYYYNKWRGEKSALGEINSQSKKGWLSSLWGGNEDGFFLNEDFWYFLVILLVSVLMYVYLKKTKHGYEISVVGESRNTAKYAGISVNKVMLRTLLISGAVCGLCGFLTVSNSHTISADNTAGGYGFTAIIVAWLSKFNTLTMIAVSFMVIFLQKGSSSIADMYARKGFDTSASSIVTGIFLLAVIGSEFFINYRLIFRSRKEEK